MVDFFFTSQYRHTRIHLVCLVWAILCLDFFYNVPRQTNSAFILGHVCNHSRKTEVFIDGGKCVIILPFFDNNYCHIFVFVLSNSSDLFFWS